MIKNNKAMTLCMNTAHLSNRRIFFSSKLIQTFPKSNRKSCLILTEICQLSKLSKHNINLFVSQIYSAYSLSTAFLYGSNYCDSSSRQPINPWINSPTLRVVVCLTVKNCCMLLKPGGREQGQFITVFSYGKSSKGLDWV